MAGVQVLSPMAHGHHGHEAHFQTPKLRLDSIFEATGNENDSTPSPPANGAFASPFGQHFQRQGSAGRRWRDATPEPRWQHSGAQRSSPAAGRSPAATGTPSPQPRSASSRSSSHDGGDAIPASTPDFTFRRTPSTAAAMSVDPGPLYRLAGRTPGRSPTPMRRLDTVVSMSIVREASRRSAATAKPATSGRRGRSTSVLRAPSGYSDDESSGSELDTPSFAVAAPSGLTDDSGSDSDAAGGSRRTPGGASARRSASRRATPLRSGFQSGSGGKRRLASRAGTITELAFEMQYQLQLRSEEKVQQLEAALAAVEADETAALEALEAAQAERAVLADDQDGVAAQEVARKRADVLAALQREHAEKAAAGQRAVSEAEEAARRDRQAAERALQAQQEAAAAIQRQQEATAAAQRQQQEQQQRQQAAQQAAAATAASPASQALAATSPPAHATSAAQPPAQPSAMPSEGRFIVAAGARQQEAACAEAAAAAEATAAPFRADKASAAARRKADKFVTLNVQQIAGTQEQVGNKSRELAQFLASQISPAAAAHSGLVLAARLVAQCEVQIQRLHAFAFPLGEVAVAVAAAHPSFIPLLLARLHAVCQLTVPKLRVYPKGTAVPAEQRLRALGYKEKEAVGANDGGDLPPPLESTDEFLSRIQGYVRLYAAVTQSDNPQNPHGLQHAWAFLARLLNELPATRLTATALEAFLKVAGFRLYAAFRGQFVKLLHFVDQVFLADLRKGNDPDSRAIATRLHTFLHDNQFAEEPEGRALPRFDASSHDRA